MGFDCGKEDAYFGTLTDRALREFQRNTGLVVDGVAGPETLRALGRLHRTVGAESAHTARERYSLPNLRTGIAGKLVVLDASPVNNGRAGLTDRIAALTAERLAPMGAVVSLPSTVDSHGGALDELARALACNEADADLVVSFHVDQIDETAPALAVFYYGSDALHFSAAGRAAAEEIRAEVARTRGLRHRGPVVGHTPRHPHAERAGLLRTLGSGRRPPKDFGTWISGGARHRHRRWACSVLPTSDGLSA